MSRQDKNVYRYVQTEKAKSQNFFSSLYLFTQ